MIVKRNRHLEVLEFSKAYADQNERDYQALAAAVNSDEIKAQTGP